MKLVQVLGSRLGMAPTVIVKSENVGIRTQRETAAQRVIANFGNQIPDRRLLCFFDDTDWQPFKDRFGKENRAFYGPLREEALPDWPDYVRRLIFVPLSAPKVAFDHVIYLYGSTCSSLLALTMSFAHELQHFVQHENVRLLWAANSLLPHLDGSVISALELRWCDIPHEREARIVSKRTAENLFGVGDVNRYVDAKIAESTTDGDRTDWECIRGLDTSTHYDLALETMLFFQRRLKDYIPELEKALQRMPADFSADVDLRKLLGRTSA